MNEHEIISKIEELINEMPYKTASVSIVMDEKTITLEKTKPAAKKAPMGFSKD